MGQEVSGPALPCSKPTDQSSPDGIYHVTVMPCYDKKLEASRQDFYNELYSTRDVDCVITTGELELLMKEKGWDLSVPVDGELGIDASISLSASVSTAIRLPELLQHPGTSSGSYLQSIVAHLQSASPTPLVLSVKMIRNADYEEYVLAEEGANGRVVFKGAKCYGFRNLQNIVRKVGKERGVRTGTGAAGRLAGRRVVRKGGATGATGMMEGKDRSYDYVEVMACPGGCVNGGGQLKPRVTSTVDEEKYERNWEEDGVSMDGMQNAKWGDKDWTKKVEEAYWRDSRSRKTLAHDLPPTPPNTPPPVLDDREVVADRVLEEMCGQDGDRRRELLRTSYRAVESEVVGLAVKW